jgi:acetyl-CoA acyltransferase
VYAAGDAKTEMLSGPFLTIPKLLQRNQLKIEDIHVWEIHEAFAAQIVANIKLMASKKACRDRLGMTEAFGEIPLDKVNIWGGSLSLGHPFGATGGRLLMTCAKRLALSGERFGVVSGCAAGGHGSAILLERVG